jgi:hypothetical protein
MKIEKRNIEKYPGAESGENIISVMAENQRGGISVSGKSEWRRVA